LEAKVLLFLLCQDRHDSGNFQSVLLLSKNKESVLLCFAGKGNYVFMTPEQGLAATRFWGKSPDLALLGSYFPQKPCTG
jgi:hypothetical protein